MKYSMILQLKILTNTKNFKTKTCIDQIHAMNPGQTRFIHYKWVIYIYIFDSFFHMDYQLQFFAKFTHFVSLLNKFYSQDRPQLAAVFDDNSDVSSPYCAVCLSMTSAATIGTGDYRSAGTASTCNALSRGWNRISLAHSAELNSPKIISLNENQYQWDAIVANVILLFRWHSSESFTE